MALGPLPPDVERFIVAHVPSVATLEALLLLRSQPPRSWSVAALVEHLFIGAPEVAAIVAHLVAHGLATRSEAGEVDYVRSGSLADAVDALAETYRTRLVVVSQLIHARQDSAGIRSFADAFRFRKD